MIPIPSSIAPGVRIHESEAMTEFFRRPRTKNRRIVAKWKKRPENWRPQMSALSMEGGAVLVMHPEMARRLRASVKTFVKGFEDIGAAVNRSAVSIRSFSQQLPRK